jgi:hypothetical protein
MANSNFIHNFSNLVELEPNNSSNFLYETIVYTLTIPLFILTAVGNGIILITIKFQARLLSSNSNYLNSNYFILNLAIADFFVGIVVMPLMIVYTVNHSKWTYGQELCDSWMSFDFLCSTASFLTLSAMSIERYKMLTTSYMRIDKHSSKCRIILFICLSWILPLISWLPVIVTQRILYGPNSFGDCSISANKYLILFLCILLYHIPLIFMVVFYTKLIIHIKKSSINNIDLDNASLNTNNLSLNKNKIISQFNNSLILRKATKSNSKIIDDLNENVLDNENPNSKFFNCDLGPKIKQHQKSISSPITTTFLTKFQIRLKFFKKETSSIKNSRNKSNQYNLKLMKQHSLKYQNGYSKRSCSNTNNNNNNNNNNNVHHSYVNSFYSEHNSSIKNSSASENELNSMLNDRNKNIDFSLNNNLESSNNNNNNNETNLGEKFLIMKQSPTTLVINGMNALKCPNSKLKSRYSFNNNNTSKKDTISLFENTAYKNLRLKRNRKAARMLGLLVTAFLICWFPFSVCYPLGQFFPNAAPNYFTIIIWWMGYLNSTINPFLYVYSNKTIRRSVRDLFYKRIWQFFLGANKINQNFRSNSLKNFVNTNNQNNNNKNEHPPFSLVNDISPYINKNEAILSNNNNNNIGKTVKTNNFFSKGSNNMNVHVKRALVVRQIKLKK